MTSRNFWGKIDPLPSVTPGHKSRTPYRNYIASLQAPHPFKKAVITACRNKSDFSFLALMVMSEF